MEYTANTTSNVRKINKHAVIDLIRFTPGGISRVDLAREIGLTRAAVTSIVNDLQALNIVQEAGSALNGGRSIILAINPNLGKFVGIEMGATHITIILVDASAQVLAELEQPFDITLAPDVCINQIATLFSEFLQSNGVNSSSIMAVGVGVPGPIVAGAGKVSFPPIMPGWDEFPIRDRLQNIWGCPVYLGNDAEFGALGEWAYGAGRSQENLAYIKIGRGIGAGLLLNGRVYRGTSGSAGEIGHITIEKNGPLCTCGNRGCLEAMAGGQAIAQKAIEAVKLGRKSMLSDIDDPETITALNVVSAARRGDLISQQIIREAGLFIGTAVASLINLFNPSMVVIGGEVSRSGDLLLEPIRKTVSTRSLRGALRGVQITAAYLGNRSTAMGAVVQALSVELHRLAEA